MLSHWFKVKSMRGNRGNKSTTAMYAGYTIGRKISLVLTPEISTSPESANSENWRAGSFSSFRRGLLTLRRLNAKIKELWEKKPTSECSKPSSTLSNTSRAALVVDVWVRKSTEKRRKKQRKLIALLISVEGQVKKNKKNNKIKNKIFLAKELILKVTGKIF